MKDRIKNFLTNNFILIFILYYCTLFIGTTSLTVDYPIIEIILKLAKCILYALFFARLLYILPEYKKLIFSTKWKERNIKTKALYVFLIIMLISLIINFILVRNRRLILLVLVILSAYKTDYKKIIKTTMFLQIALTSIIVILSLMGITQNYIVPRGTLKRYSMGFAYTTNLAQMVIFASILYMYSKGTKTEWKDLFVMQLLNGFTYFITDSRAEFIILEFSIIVAAIYKIIVKTNIKEKLEKVKKVYASFFAHTFFIYPIIFLIIVMCYPKGGVFKDMNKALSNRLAQTYDNIATYGLPPFGEDIEFLGFGLKEKVKYGQYKSNYIDNEYIQMAFKEGTVFAICFIILLNLLLIMLYKRKKYKEVILCSVYLLFGLINPRIINILYCPILFLIIPSMIDYKEGLVNNNNKN